MAQTEKIGVLTGIVGQTIFVSIIFYFSFSYKLLTSFSNLFDSTILLIILELLISLILLGSSLGLASKGLGSLIHVWSLSLGTNILNIHVVFLEGLMGVPFILLVFPFLISLLTTSFSTFQFLTSPSSEQEPGSSPMSEETRESLSAGTEPPESPNIQQSNEKMSSEQEKGTPTREREERRETEERERKDPLLKRGDINSEEIQKTLEIPQLQDLLNEVEQAEETVNNIKFSLRELTDQERKIRNRLAEEIEISLNEVFEERGITRIPIEKAARTLGFSADQFSSFENIVSYFEKGEFTNYELSGGFIRKKE